MTDDYDLEYFSYKISGELIVTLKDGKKLDYEHFREWRTFIIDGETYYFTVNHYQSYDNRWMAGEHYITYAVAGIEREAYVTIKEGIKIASVNIEPIEIEEGTNINVYHMYNEMTGSYDIFGYEYDLQSLIEFTVVTEDGSEYKSNNGYVEIDNKKYSINIRQLLTNDNAVIGKIQFTVIFSEKTLILP